MKLFLAVLATAVAVVGIYAMTAGAGEQAVTPAQFAKLEKKVAKLQKTVTTLKRSVARINGILSCLRKVVPVSEYGNPGAASGYVYRNGTSDSLTTALDVTAQGETPGAFLSVVNSSCVSSGASARFQVRRHALHP